MISAYFIILAGVSGWCVAEVCQDVDSAACLLLDKSQSDFCNNSVIANSVCRKHCNQCPVMCYDCRAPLGDPFSCSTNTTCRVGEACSTKELISSDGRHEYSFGCLTIDTCDGKPQAVAVGRRSSDKRNINIKCCLSDFCNDGSFSMTSTAVPMTTTSHAACYRRIQFLVKDSNATGYLHLPFIKHLLTSVVHKLEIGPGKSTVGVASYDNHLHVKLQLSDQHTQQDVLTAISNIKARTNNALLGPSLDQLSTMLKHHNGTDVLVIVSDGKDYSTPADSHHVTHHVKLADLRRQGVKVISLDTGYSSVISQHADHVIHLRAFTAAEYRDVLSKLSHAICN